MRKLIIAIDGPVGSGKSTVARRVAELLGYVYVDTGAMYRALALKAQHKGMPLASDDDLARMADETHIDLKSVGGAQKIYLDGVDVSAAIRGVETSQAASKIAVIPGVRRVLVAEQRRVGQLGGVVMEGRDIGTIVFPDADLKIYLTASAEVRAQRRWLEHQAKGDAINLEQTFAEVRDRDRRDLGRQSSPLKRADDAVLVDSTAMDAEEVARLIVQLAREKESR
ncbi:MAG TPA: (d)CMP kinase [Candidatus Acidoferrales bacterium]|nr:(d)CMP kinase [Candidatus Acidoferrales bacterium]